MNLIQRCLLVVFLSSSACAQNFTVKMLNSHDGKIMVFEPPVLKIQKGDTVLFESVDAGHNSQSHSLPAGAKPWKSDISKDYNVKFDQPGTYVYICEPHIVMGMIGIIQVGDTKDVARVNQSLKELGPNVLMNKERLNEYPETLEQLK